MERHLLIVLLSFFQLLFVWGCKKSDSSSDPIAKSTSSNTSLGGKILYEAVTDGIHLFNVNSALDQKLFDGTYPERISSGKIIYVLNNPNRLMISNEEGTSKSTLVVNSSMYFQCPRASSDGKLIALHNLYSSTINSISKGTIVYKDDGTVLAKLDNLFHPYWTPDGKLVLSGSYGNLYGPQTTLQEGIFITSKDLDNPKRIDPNLTAPMMPSVSPDGGRIAFIYDGHVWVMNIDGSNLKQITKSTTKETYPYWTPDGKYIVFNYTKGGSVMAIVPSNETTTISDDTECYIFTGENQLLNSANQINNW